MEQLLVLEFLGRMKGFWTNQQQWIRQNVLEVLNQAPSETSATGKGTVKRKYHYSYLDIGYVDTSDNKSQWQSVAKQFDVCQQKCAVILREVHPDC
jgi:hypothetical protein